MQDILLFIAGLAVGAMNAVAGGGGMIVFPALVFAGIPPLVANVTHNIVVLPGSISAAYSYRKYIRKVPRYYLFLLVPCLLGAAAGALILRNTSTEKFQDVVPLLVLFAVVLFAFQPLLHFHLNRHLRSKSKGLVQLIPIALALIPIAIYGGYFGAGFGFLMLAFLGFTNLHDINKMNGLKNLGGICISSASLICLIDTGLINWRYGLVMASGAVIGGYYGGQIAQKLPSHAVRIAIILIGLVTAGYLALNS